MAEHGLTERSIAQKAKRYSFTDSIIARYANITVKTFVQNVKNGISFQPYKYVDTCAAEFESKTPYYYSAYAQRRRS